MKPILISSISTVAAVLIAAGSSFGQLPNQPPPPPPGAPIGRPPVGQSPIGQPPVGQPPVGQPPVGQPPVGQPPVGQPPVGQPPVGQPPGGQPPGGQPPGGQPPGGQPPGGQPPVGQPPVGQSPLGGPLSGLTSDQLAEFTAGRAHFLKRETRASGLGPIFNNVSCVSCHRAPAPGGSSRILVTRFGRTENGVFDPLENLGGSLLQARAIAPGIREVIPSQANTVGRRQTTPLFGLGLLEAIADQTILDLVPASADSGVPGRAAEIIDITTNQPRVGRFGWKAQHATLLAFTADAFLNEMGITNRFFPKENAPNGRTAVLAQFDKVADPEDAADPVTGRSGIDAVADFQRFLAAPPTRRLTADGIAGRTLFKQIGCADCHVPELTTGPSDIAALDSVTVSLYSDLLLHDMGSLGDGIAQADAGPNEFRTPPLWGLRFSAPYLHDGRAVSIGQAIRAHAGQGTTARDQFNALSPAQRQQMIEFLKSI